MKKKTVIVLSMAEAIEMVLENMLKMVREVAAKDPETMMELLKEGIPSVGNMNEQDVCDYIFQFNLGRAVAEKEGVDMVMVAMNLHDHDVVFDRHDPNYDF